MNLKKTIGLATAGLSLIFAGSVFAEPYMVVSKGNSGLPDDLEAMVSSRGGVILSTIPEIGVAVVESDNSSFMQSFANARSIQGVVPNFSIDMPQIEARPMVDNPPNSGDDDFFFTAYFFKFIFQMPHFISGEGMMIFIFDNFDFTKLSFKKSQEKIRVSDCTNHQCLHI